MSRTAFAIAGLAVPLAVTAALSSIGASRPKAVDLAGVSWYSDVSEATKLAERDRKPLLILQMIGRLDDAYC